MGPYIAEGLNYYMLSEEGDMSRKFPCVLST